MMIISHECYVVNSGISNYFVMYPGSIVCRAAVNTTCYQHSDTGIRACFKGWLSMLLAERGHLRLQIIIINVTIV